VEERIINQVTEEGTGLHENLIDEGGNKIDKEVDKCLKKYGPGEAGRPTRRKRCSEFVYRYLEFAWKSQGSSTGERLDRHSHRANWKVEIAGLEKGGPWAVGKTRGEYKKGKEEYRKKKNLVGVYMGNTGDGLKAFGGEKKRFIRSEKSFTRAGRRCEKNFKKGRGVKMGIRKQYHQRRKESMPRVFKEGGGNREVLWRAEVAVPTKKTTREPRNH